ncbi:MAG TPA: hypothetical protein VHR64_08520, partial [Thermomicrobiales bacterium]|nr:hypothetical protein [Thermomicrobiales bacterium]
KSADGVAPTPTGQTSASLVWRPRIIRSWWSVWALVKSESSLSDDPTTDGEATAAYLALIVKPMGSR